MSESSRYLVTGGAGFIGSHLAAGLLELGHRVVIIDDLSSGRLENLDGLIGPDLDFVNASLLDEASLLESLDGVAAVFHQAAIPSVPRSFADPGATLRANAEGTARLFEACRQSGVNRIVCASSSSVYGNTDKLPKREDMQPNPLSPYALSKLAGESLARIYARHYGLEIVAMRYFNVFGPRQDPESQYAAVVPRFITAMLQGEQPTIYGDGEQSRDFTYIDNVVEANFIAAGVLDPAVAPAGPAGDDGLPTRAPAQGEALITNIACGGRFTLLELATAINEILGTDIEPLHDPPRVGDVRHSQASIDLARERLGFVPKVSFEDGLRRTVAWYREQ